MRSGGGLERVTFGADVVYDGLGTPRAPGVVTLQRAGDDRAATVVAVESLDAWDARSRGRGPGAGRGDAGASRDPEPSARSGTPRRAGRAISTPVVNAHTHLDLSRMPFTPGSYVEFVRSVIAHGHAGHRGLAAAREGLDEILASGVRAIGDIVTDADVMRWLLARDDVGGVAYWEVFAPDPADADATFDATVRQLREFRALERPGGMRVGLSPHTPHTVSAPLLEKLARLARANDVPLQIHVAEDPAEAAFHRDGRGPLMELMGPLLGDGFRPSGRSPVGYLGELGVLDAEPTLVHGVHVDEDDVRRIQAAGCVVVHCPRSNRALGSTSFPWATYMRHGVTVAFGTDSRGSSPDLSVLAEVAAARTVHGAAMSPKAWLRAATKGGERALGRTPPVVRRGDPAARLVAWPDVVTHDDAACADDGGRGIADRHGASARLRRLPELLESR